MKLELLEDALNHIRVNHYGLLHGDADCLRVRSIREIGTDCFITIDNIETNHWRSFNLTEIVSELEESRKGNN